MRIEIDEVCSFCDGTGIYVGMAERDGYGIVCNKCSGTGGYRFVHEYEHFKNRKVRSDVNRVLQCNPGIVVGSNLDFGGKSYIEWLENGYFESGSEMRKFTCPAWWFQTANYKQKPEWEQCIISGTFSGCKEFLNKKRCWEIYDKEHNQTEKQENICE
jgi:hypothetical protein